MPSFRRSCNRIGYARIQFHRNCQIFWIDYQMLFCLCSTVSAQTCLPVNSFIKLATDLSKWFNVLTIQVRVLTSRKLEVLNPWWSYKRLYASSIFKLHFWITVILLHLVVDQTMPESKLLFVIWVGEQQLIHFCLRVYLYLHLI